MSFESLFGLVGRREDRDELTLWIEPAAWLAAARSLRDEHGYRFLSDLTAIDYLDRLPRFDVSAVLLNMSAKASLRLKAMVGEDEPLESLTALWSGADWYEREIYDLFGLKFLNHHNLSRILLPSDYTGYPLRKDYPVTGPADSPFR